jgi:phosphate transport system permease protein
MQRMAQQSQALPPRQGVFARVFGRVAEDARTGTGDFIFRSLVTLLAVGTLVLILWISYQLFDNSRDSIRAFGFGFIWARDWNPVRENFGALPFIFGTTITALIALCIAGPIGLGTAIFLSEYAPGYVRGPLSFLAELLAAIPSIVYGLWGIFVFSPWMARTGMPFLKDYFGWIPIFSGPSFGVSILTAGIILSIMVIPTVIAISRDVLLAVPNSQREGMLAVGATKWEAIRMAVLPFARAGVIGATILALGRAVGETMAVTMVIGNRPQITEELFRPGYTMASVIANEFNESQSPLHTQSMIEIGLILFFVTILINIVARILVWKVAAGQRLTGI